MPKSALFQSYLVFNYEENVIIYTMLKSKVIEVLKTFSQAEIKSFRNYINSPFHNSNRKVLKLYELIRKHYPELNSKQLEKETLFKKLYPAKKYSDIVMRILISDMLRLAEEFLAYQGYSKEFLAEKKFLLEELEERNLGTLFNRHIKEAEQYLEKEVIMNNSYFLERFEIESRKVNFLISWDKQDKTGAHLVKQGEYLADFFLVNGFNTLQEQHEISEVLNVKYDFSLIEILFSNMNVESLIKDLKERNYKYFPVIEMYYYLYVFNKDIHNSELYYKLKDSVLNNLKFFDAEERYNLFLGLESCAVTRSRVGIKNGHEELMEVYELMLNRKAFSESNRKSMQANLFRNIFYTAVVLKRYEWAEKFVNDYSGLLLPEQKPDMYNYTIALLSFERKDYNKALEFISRVNYGFFVFKYDAKILMLKIYYELRSFEPALSLIDSFSHFLTKNKSVSEIYKEPFMKFFKFSRLLIKHALASEMDKGFSLAELLKQAELAGHFISKRWILEKINEFK